MTKEEIKKKSIEKINIAITIIQCKKEKITNKRISEVSGLSEITVKRYRSKKVSPKPKNVSPQKENVSATSENVSSTLRNVSPSKDIYEGLSSEIKRLRQDSFQHFMRRRMF